VEELPYGGEVQRFAPKNKLFCLKSPPAREEGSQKRKLEGGGPEREAARIRE